MVSSASIRGRARTSVLTWALLALVVSADGRRSLAQSGHEWVGQQVITKPGAVLARRQTGRR